MERVLTVFVSGLITIGIITALFMPGRQTVQFTKEAGKASQGLLRTSITGK
jgi:hypothetical protein